MNEELEIYRNSKKSTNKDILRVNNDRKKQIKVWNYTENEMIEVREI